MFVAILLFAVGFILLIKGGDWFVDGATNIARRFKISELLIGATVVSIGTTLPEVMVSATSAISGHGELAYGNAVGSIICNTSLIAALTIAIRPTDVNRKSFKLPVIFFFVASIIFLISSYLLGGFSRWVGIVLLLIFAIYMTLTIIQAKKNPDMEPIKRRRKKVKAQPEVKTNPLWLDIILLIVGAVLIAFGAHLLVENGTIIASKLGVPESVIALTFVALGTSLPELVTAITALVKKHSALSLGNIIGANLFNLVLVGGLSITLNPFALPAGKTILGINSSLIIDLPIMIGVMLLLTIPTLIKGKLCRWQGITLLSVYSAFCIVQFIV